MQENLHAGLLHRPQEFGVIAQLVAVLVGDAAADSEPPTVRDDLGERGRG